jgi:hypothetical protein
MDMNPPRPLRIHRPAAKQLPALLLVALGIFLLGGIGPNIALAALSVLVLVVGVSLLWRPGEPPVLLLVFGWQWIQASISVFQANWLGLDVINNTPEGADTDTAIALTLVGLAIMSLGMRLGAGPERVDVPIAARHVALTQPISRWFWLYVIASLVAALALAFTWTVPGLSQPIQALASMKWAFFFMLAYATLVRASGAGPLFALAFAFELALGIGGFFSDFKAVFFVTLIAVAASGKRISAGAIFALSSLGALLIVFGIVWTAVKDDYRNFVSLGTGEQVVAVDYWTGLAKLAELLGELNSQDLSDASNKLLRRLTYVKYFAVVIDYVPNTIPHENGAIMWDAISRPFMPRILFSGKSVIDDTERTNLYTGGAVGYYANTSVSLGWIAETYIDFGEYLMMGAIFLIGYFYGRIYRWCLHGSGANGPLGFASATAVLFPVFALESSFTKTFGGVVVSVLIVWLIVKFAVPRWCPWLEHAVSR